MCGKAGKRTVAALPQGLGSPASNMPHLHQVYLWLWLLPAWLSAFKTNAGSNVPAALQRLMAHQVVPVLDALLPLGWPYA